MQYKSFSEKDTQAIAGRFGRSLPKNSVVCFFGDLGAGKTTFIKGLAEGASGCSKEDVTSPTFTYLNVYEGHKTIYHFDLYRLHDADEFMSMGFDEYLQAGGICCIEWSERIASILPSTCFQVFLMHIDENSRLIEIKPWDDI